uniref:Uncharacterized protein n=1 Tax=Strix occidentalis caurina TaxID=311401 RepID=A0A8D0KYN4_STROC
MEKNHAKQEVIMVLTEQMARELSDPLQEANTITAETLYKQQEEIDHLKDDIDAYKTQNQFLNSEIHQVTRLWTSVAENEKALLMKVRQNDFFSLVRAVTNFFPKLVRE